MSFFTVPASLARHLEKIMRDFVWSCNDSSNDLHWINWREVFCPKQEGRLSIRPFCEMNDALKTKWIWRCAKEDDVLWRKVIASK